MSFDASKDPKVPSISAMANPAVSAFAIAPADAELARYPTALFVGGAGNLVVVMREDGDGAPVTLAVQPGYHPLRVRRVNAATTATGIVGLVGG